jgi:hypothetical protein
MIYTFSNGKTTREVDGLNKFEESSLLKWFLGRIHWLIEMGAQFVFEILITVSYSSLDQNEQSSSASTTYLM